MSCLRSQQNNSTKKDRSIFTFNRIFRVFCSCWFAFSSGFMWAFAGSVLLACLVSKICTVSIRIHSLTVKG